MTTRFCHAAGLCAICGLLWGLPSAGWAEEASLAGLWPQWRGPHRDATVPSSDAWPESLGDGHLKTKWRVKLGPGYPGPIVASDRVFVAETRDEQEEVVRALDRSTGAELWQVAWPGAMKVPPFARRNGDWIRSTPAYDGESLFVLGMRDVLVCLDAAEGKPRWRVDFTQRFGTSVPSFGAASSPLVIGEHVYVQAANACVKLDKRDGATIWRVLEGASGMTGGAFSSPVMVDVHGAPQLVVQTRSQLAGVEPNSGGVLWSHDVKAFRGMNILTPTVVEDRVFTSAYGGKSLLVGLPSGADGVQPETLWTNKQQGYMSSPVLIDGHLYVHLRNRRLTCIELASGTTRWTTEPLGEYWSMATQGDTILALDAGGTLYLVRANPERFELLDKRRVSDEETWAHLAVAGDELFVRGLRSIAAYQWR